MKFIKAVSQIPSYRLDIAQPEDVSLNTIEKDVWNFGSDSDKEVKQKFYSDCSRLTFSKRKGELINKIMTVWLNTKWSFMKSRITINE